MKAEKAKLEAEQELKTAQGPVEEQIKVLTEALTLESNRRELVERMAGGCLEQRQKLEAQLQKLQEAGEVAAGKDGILRTP